MSKTLRLFYRIFSCLLNISNGHNAPAPPSFSFVKYPRPLRVNNKIYWEVVVNWATYYLKINIFKYLFKTFLLIDIYQHWPMVPPVSYLRWKQNSTLCPVNIDFLDLPTPLCKILNMPLKWRNTWTNSMNKIWEGCVSFHSLNPVGQTHPSEKFQHNPLYLLLLIWLRWGQLHLITSSKSQ